MLEKIIAYVFFSGKAGEDFCGTYGKYGKGIHMMVEVIVGIAGIALTVISIIVTVISIRQTTKGLLFSVESGIADINFRFVEAFSGFIYN